MSGAAAATLRPATPADIPAIARIYAHHVITGLASFEEVPPSAGEIGRRHAEVQGHGLPWIVALDGGGAVCGYAYAAPYRPRAAYRFTLEDSIYVAEDAMRRGIGRALLTRLMADCAAANYRQIVAVIGDSANTASVGLHERLGFRRVGLLPAVGFKHGRWVDIVLMQRDLGDGAATMP